MNSQGTRSSRCVSRVRFVCLLLLVATASSLSISAFARAATVIGDMPVRPDALPQSRFDAIVREATAIAATAHGSTSIQLPARWNTLDPDTLAAMIAMPAFARIDPVPREVLVDQAAAWDMFAFERPSDAARLWERLWPRPPGSDPGAAPDTSPGIELTPAASWSDNAFAMATVFACFPAVAWSAPGDATVAATRSNVAWQWMNWTGWDGFHECVMQNNQKGFLFPDSQPSVRRFNAVSAILTTKFEDELATDRCKRTGPDSCLLLFQALFSLDRHNPKLVGLLGKMEPAFDLDRPIVVPELPKPTASGDATRKAKRGKVSDEQLAVLDAPIEEMQLRDIFLTLKLPVLLDRPDGWRRGELDRTLGQAMQLSILSERLQNMEGWRWGRQSHPRYFDDPWQWIDAAHADVAAPFLRELGVSYARSDGCALSGKAIAGTPTFWVAYQVENIRLGHKDCSNTDYLQLPQTYQLALDQNDAAAQARVLAPLQPIGAMLTADGPLREHALDAMATTCGALKTGESIDPWKLCAGVAARAAALAQAKAQAQRDAMPPVDPYACDPQMVVRAAAALHYSTDADFWSSEQTACRLEPWRTGEAIVALTYLDGDASSGRNSATEDVDFDLDVVVMRVDNSEILARSHAKKAIPSDAVRFESIGIDTAPYVLAPDRRAFGIVVSHSTHCYACSYAQTDLTLYLQDGSRLDSILQTMFDEAEAEATPECPDMVAQTKRTLKVGTTASHGLADLLLTTSTTAQDDQDPKAVACLAATTTVKASFDGSAYVVPDGIDPPFQ